MKTKFASAQTVNKDWFLVDAKDKTLGRMASHIAHVLRGKHKAEFTPHADTGDFVVVLNAKDVRVSGRKTEQKIYWDYTGYPGGERGITFEKQLLKNPCIVIERAVKGMLPKGPLGRKMYKKLKVYEGNEHPHVAQNPKSLTIRG